jgi:hypothetical protein
MLKLENVSKVYKGGKKAVNHLSLEIKKGEFKEEYDRTGDLDESVAAGIQRSGPLVTAAAAILAFAFAAYAFGDLVFLKMLGSI